MENISEINTVQDLLKANEETSPAETICKEIFKYDPSVGLEIVKEVLNELTEFHVEVANKKIDERENDTVAGWIKDATVLRLVKEMIDEVEL